MSVIGVFCCRPVNILLPTRTTPRCADLDEPRPKRVGEHGPGWRQWLHGFSRVGLRHRRRLRHRV